MAATTVTRPTLTDGVSDVTGDVVNAAFFGTNVYDVIDALFTTPNPVQFEKSVNGSAYTLAVKNTSNTASSHASLGLVAGGTSGGDPFILFDTNGASVWAVGLDNSDNDNFKLSQNGTLGTSDKLTVSVGGNIVPGSAALATNATDGFIYLQSCAGTPSGTPTAYTGRVALIYDTTNNKLAVYNGAWKQTAALT